MAEYGVAKTGRIRYRVQHRMFRSPLVVLQIELAHTYYDSCYQEKKTSLIWRDAQPEDITEKGKDAVQYV